MSGGSVTWRSRPAWGRESAGSSPAPPTMKGGKTMTYQRARLVMLCLALLLSLVQSLPFMVAPVPPPATTTD